MTIRTSFLALTLFACVGTPLEQSAKCDAGWSQVATPDSAVTFCLPPGFQRVKNGRMWTRAAQGTTPPYVVNDWILVAAIPEQTVALDDGPWPPSLLRDTTKQCADCLDVRGYSIRWDSVGTRTVRVELAYGTGGFVGVRDKPMLKAAWRAATGDWILVQAEAARFATLDVFRSVVRSTRAGRKLKPST